MEIKIKKSDAENIASRHIGSRTWDMDRTEAAFNYALKELGHTVIILHDEDTKEETRPLLVEDAVEQYMKKDRAGRRNVAAFTDAVNPSYPSYLSVNKEANGTIAWTAREAGNDGNKIVHVYQTPSELAAFAEQLYLATRCI